MSRPLERERVVAATSARANAKLTRNGYHAARARLTMGRSELLWRVAAIRQTNAKAMHSNVVPPAIRSSTMARMHVFERQQ